MAAKQTEMTKVRIEVDQLLQDAASEKLLRDHTDEALAKLKKAEKLIQKYKLPDLWSALCAYRKGHLLLRKARTNDELLDADDCFNEAMRAESLGPLPALYRLAVWYRLRIRGGIDEQSYQNRKNKVFDQAEKVIQKAQKDGGSKGTTDVQLQDHMFNLLELACYFSGADYCNLDGMGLPIQSSSRQGSWAIVGRDPQWSYVMLSEDEAIEELESMTHMPDFQDALFFQLSDPKTSGRDKPLRRHWKYRQADWVKTQPKILRLLIFLLENPGCTAGEIVEYFNDEHLRTSVTKTKERLLKELKKLPSFNHEEIFVPSRDYGYKINPDMKIFGAVEFSTIPLYADKG